MVLYLLRYTGKIVSNSGNGIMREVYIQVFHKLPNCSPKWLWQVISPLLQKVELSYEIHLISQHLILLGIFTFNLKGWKYVLKRFPFNYRGLEWKSRKSRNTWSNRQIWPWNTEWSRARANRDLPRERTGHSKHPLPTTQEKTLHMDITRWPTQKSDWLYSWQPKMEKLYTVSKIKTGSWLWLGSWTPYCQIQT